MAGLFEGGNEPPGSLKAICMSNVGQTLRRQRSGHHGSKRKASFLLTTAVPIPALVTCLINVRLQNTPILCMFMICAMDVPCMPSLDMNDAFRTEGYQIEEYLLSVGLDERLGTPKSHGCGKSLKKPKTKGGSNPSPNAAPDQQPSEFAD
ncbi:hypothetical protein ANN_25243 [Periplaneta americana]|uniref:Uncharacterized protein n=1 Tax=Periplaneta americana TaxID=6978 RepID=A0ABQ8S157_PERAM|nr:hypothetical protein ANN_25243 [Periplaneta americana]